MSWWEASPWRNWPKVTSCFSTNQRPYEQIRPGKKSFLHSYCIWVARIKVQLICTVDLYDYKYTGTKYMMESRGGNKIEASCAAELKNLMWLEK